jgi:hypothetical protein
MAFFKKHAEADAPAFEQSMDNFVRFGTIGDWTLCTVVAAWLLPAFAVDEAFHLYLTGKKNRSRCWCGQLCVECSSGCRRAHVANSGKDCGQHFALGLRSW